MKITLDLNGANAQSVIAGLIAAMVGNEMNMHIKGDGEMCIKQEPQEVWQQELKREPEEERVNFAYEWMENNTCRRAHLFKVDECGNRSRVSVCGVEGRNPIWSKNLKGKKKCIDCQAALSGF